METLLVHEDVAGVFLPEMLRRFQSAGVEVRCCPRTIEFVKSSGVNQASEGDWDAEYSDLILAIKVVRDADEAIEHINHHGSGHTESIVTEDVRAASHFMEQVDAAGGVHKPSAPLADGFRFWFG